MNKSKQTVPPVTLAKGKFLELQKLEYRTEDGSVHAWESVARVNSRGAVVILATLVPSGRILLIRQFRPPANAYVWEFPAGLIDPGETPEETAVRELREETGYRGKVLSCSRPVFSSPGLTSETLYLATMEIEEAGQENPVPEFDGAESIETFAVHPGELGAFLDKAAESGDQVDAKVQISRIFFRER